MRAVVLKDIGKLEFEDRPIPKASGNKVLIKVAYCGICGSDLSAYRTLSFPPGTVMGHEFSGWVEAIGENVTNCKIGQRVAIRPCSVCFKCPWCNEDRISLCPDHIVDTIGLKNNDGAYADFTLVDDFMVFPLDDSTSLSEAAVLEPLAASIHAVQEGNIKEGDNVLISGAGSIGLLMFQYLKMLKPGRIVVWERSPFRRSKVEELGGATVVSTQEEVEEIVKEFPRKGFDVVLEAAGAKQCVQASVKLVAKGGVVVWMGQMHEPLEVDQFALTISGIKINCSIGYFVEHWDIGMKLLQEGKVNLKMMVTDEYPLERIDDAFQALFNPEKDMKIMLKVHDEN